jgi:hypothetical protein
MLQMKNYTFLIIVLSLFILLSLTMPAGAYPPNGPGAFIHGVQIFPPDDIWNVAVDQLPVDPHSSDYVAKIGINSHLHPDFGSGLWEGHRIGIPFNVVTGPISKRQLLLIMPARATTAPIRFPQTP